jgi:predicted ATPase
VALPVGTVTFVFTDIEGSTGLLHDLGEVRYAEALAAHRRVLRSAFGAEGGVEVDTQGDALFVAFPTAPGALRAAAEAVSALTAGPVRVRMGIHTGTPHVAEEGYVGMDVHRAARIAACGHGGQVLISAPTAALVDTAALRDLGEHRLKDLSAPERIFQLGVEEFPPLRSLYGTNLPVPATPFLGRTRELADVLGMLARDDVRLLTLTGPGGTGKTRLGLQAAAEASERHSGGVFWVPLASLRESQIVLEAAARALGAKNGLAEHIADRSVLVLFDNFEQVVDAAGELSELLAACPNLQLLVTSREVLRVPGEHAYPVPPLEPEDGAALFLARARAIRPSFVDDEKVRELCTRLEQLPLALELAAARVSVLSPERLLDRISTRLDVLKAGRGVDPRQQTLRATIEWSYDLLSDDEQGLFARLAVFEGGCTLEAAEEICDADVDTLQSLVDKSLVRVRDSDRFWMLETIREYANGCLEGSSEHDVMARRHADWFAALADESYTAQLEPRSESDAMAAMDREQANLRAAVAWSRESGSAALQLRILTGASEVFLRGSQREFREQLEGALALGVDDAELHSRAEALRSFACYRQGDLPAARTAAEHALALANEAADPRTNAAALGYLANVAQAEGRFEEAQRLYEEVAEAHRAAENNRGIGISLVNLGDLALSVCNYDRAVTLLLEAVDLGRRYDEMTLLTATLNLATAYVHLGRLGEAEEAALEGIGLARAGNELVEVSCLLRVFAAIAVRRGEAERGARLLGAAARLREEIDLSLEPSEQVLDDDVLHRLRSTLEPGKLEVLMSAGRRLSLAEAIDESLPAR